MNLLRVVSRDEWLAASKELLAKEKELAGSADLVNTLMPYGLIDGYRLMIHPVVVGSGKRLFSEESDTTALRLVETRRFGSGIVVLTYQPAGE
jgi:dihydrofolate reductase